MKNLELSRLIFLPSGVNSLLFVITTIFPSAVVVISKIHGWIFEMCNCLGATSIVVQNEFAL